MLMIENYRSGLLWRLGRGNRYLRAGLRRADFRGGWLSTRDAPAAIRCSRSPAKGRTTASCAATCGRRPGATRGRATRTTCW